MKRGEGYSATPKTTPNNPPEGARRDVEGQTGRIGLMDGEG